MHWFFKASLILSIPLLALLTIFLILPQILPTKEVSNSSLSGFLIQNQIWSGEIHIDGDLITATATKIYIKPGTKILIAKKGDKFNLDYLPVHLRNGINQAGEIGGVKKGEPFWDEREKVQVHLSYVEAQGSKDQPILISSDDPKGSPYDINLIEVRAGSFSNVNFSNYRRLEIGRKVSISDSQFSNSGDCSICIEKGSPSIASNVFKDSVRSYITVGVASPQISGNKFLESRGDGLLFHGTHLTNVIVLDNFFHLPQKKAIIVIPINEGGVIARNYFSTGDIKLPCNSKIRLMRNLIKVKVIFDNLGDCQGVYTFDQNYWDMQDKDRVLQSRIVGGTDKFLIEIPDVLKSPPSSLMVE